jgi:hypothetical protein
MSGSTSAYGAVIVAVRVLLDLLYVSLKLAEVSLLFDCLGGALWATLQRQQKSAMLRFARSALGAAANAKGSQRAGLS